MGEIVRWNSLVSATPQGTQDDNKTIPFKDDGSTKADAARLAELESKIMRDNGSTGRALREIRDKRLYRMAYSTFEHYVEERWHMSKAHAYRLIKFADNLDLSPIGDKPKNEHQSRAKAAAQKNLEKVVKPAPEPKTKSAPKPTYKNQIVEKYEFNPSFVGQQMKKEEQLMSKQEEKGEYDWLLLHQTQYTHLVERARHYLDPTEQKQFDEFIKKNPISNP